MSIETSCLCGFPRSSKIVYAQTQHMDQQPPAKNRPTKPFICKQREFVGAFVVTRCKACRKMLILQVTTTSVLTRLQERQDPAAGRAMKCTTDVEMVPGARQVVQLCVAATNPRTAADTAVHGTCQSDIVLERPQPSWHRSSDISVTVCKFSANKPLCKAAQSPHSGRCTPHKASSAVPAVLVIICLVQRPVWPIRTTCSHGLHGRA